MSWTGMARWKGMPGAGVVLVILVKNRRRNANRFNNMILPKETPLERLLDKWMSIQYVMTTYKPVSFARLLNPFCKLYFSRHDLWLHFSTSLYNLILPKVLFLHNHEPLRLLLRCFVFLCICDGSQTTRGKLYLERIGTNFRHFVCSVWLTMTLSPHNNVN